MNERFICRRNGDHMIGTCDTGEEFLYDFEDQELLKNHKWRLHRGAIET